MLFKYTFRQQEEFVVLVSYPSSDACSPLSLFELHYLCYSLVTAVIYRWDLGSLEQQKCAKALILFGLGFCCVPDLVYLPPVLNLGELLFLH